MDPAAFDNSFRAIQSLNATDGPPRNVLEPKFRAREQMENLLQAIQNALLTSPGRRGMQQLCRCLVFLATNHLETDEEKESVARMREAYTVARLSAQGQVLGDPKGIEPTPLEEIIATEKPFITKELSFAFCVEFLEVHNTLGLYLCNRDAAMRVNDSKHVLKVAEAGYKAWDEWFLSQPSGCTMTDIPMNAETHLMDESRVPAGALDAYRERFDMDNMYTSTLYFLAQVYTSLGKPLLASQYCHHTMYLQLLNRKEFSKKVWATNVLQLNGFYSSRLEYGRALHCLQAGEYMMPRDSADEDTMGMVAWTYGRFYLHRLRHFADLKRGTVQPTLTVSELAGWWRDFPLPIPPPADLPPINTFEEARDTFRLGKKWLDEALGYYKIDGCCGDHIEILQDLCRLYDQLIVFEPRTDRRIAMHQRRAELIEALPGELNFQAYTTVIRQLLFDLGNIYTEVLDLRVKQRREPQEGDVPISDAKMNELCLKAQSFFRRFCDTFVDPQKKVVPDVLEAELRLPYFRALMRIAQLDSRGLFKTPKQEYKGIAETTACFQRAVDFAKLNPMGGEEEVELDLAKQMVVFLPRKQQGVWKSAVAGHA